MTNAITYQDHANGLDIVVKVGGRVSGYIRRGHWGWRYQPGPGSREPLWSSALGGRRK
jgi:hypothetical protein